MSKITNIVNLINQTLEGSTLSSKRFQKGELYSLAELMKKEDNEVVTYPVIVDNEGDGTEVQLNDNLPYQSYHRIIEISLSDNGNDDFGDGDTSVEETTMKMVVFANRRIMQFQVDDIITAINVGFPASLSKTQLSTLGNWFSQVDFEITDINIDKQSVWSDEFGSEQPLTPYYYVFAVNYKIQSHIMAGCYAIC